MTVEAPTAWPAWDDPAFYAQDLPVIHAAMAAQRRGAPVHWYEPGGFWVLSKWDDLRYVGSHPELFSSRFGFLINDAGDPDVAAAQLQPWAREQLAQPGLTAAQKRAILSRGKVMRAWDDAPANTDLHMVILDPPRHQEVRRILSQALSPKLVRSLGPMIAEVTDELLDQIEPGEVTDIIPVIGGIPAALIASLIGVPRELHAQFGAWAKSTMTLSSLPADSDPEVVARLRSDAKAMVDYAYELVEQRRADGGTGDDLISGFLRAELDGAPLSPEMMVTYATSLLSAGSDSTRHLLGWLVHALGERPDQRELLTQSPDLMVDAVEETLRYYPVVWGQCRTAMQDVELRGKQIRKDDYVLQVYASADRDEEVWENADEYDITRSRKNGHLGFGWGEHVCPGSVLVRKDAPIVLERIISRFASWEPAGQPERHTSTLFNGLQSLPVRFYRR